ncbi:DSBA-like thioredoxin domain-containing protein, partial [Kalaharituber pfeilii]
LTFYFDILSPFSYLGYSLLRSYPVFPLSVQQQLLTIDFRPVNIAQIVLASGNLPPPPPPGSDPNVAFHAPGKLNYGMKDMSRRAHKYGIPILDVASVGLPTGFPLQIDTSGIQRVLLVLRTSYPDIYHKVITAYFTALWVQKQDFMQPGVDRKILSETLPNDPELVQKILKDAAEPSVVEELSKNSLEVVDAGGFGLPWIEATNSKGQKETYWGSDQLGQVLDFLDL